MVLAVTTASRLAFVPFKDAIANRMAYLFRIPQKPKTSVSVPLELAAARRFVILDNGPGDRLARVPSDLGVKEKAISHRVFEKLDVDGRYSRFWRWIPRRIYDLLPGLYR
jgi:hypothetical protein